jgi:hypothetical protein
MKRIRIFLIIVLLAMGFSVYAWSPAPRTQYPKKCVAVPLDGALLVVLGIAGFSYYIVRRKRNKKEQ